ncbi:MAG TPA: hypothetical protein VF484_09135 [Candidatus Limnocylindrales bacterium]
MHLDRRLLGWGLFFILLGAVPLAVRANAVDPDLVGRWPTLWPFLLIGWGLGLVLRASPIAWIGGTIVAVTFGLMGGGAIATGFAGAPVFSSCGSGAGQAFQASQGSFGTTGHLGVEFNCGTLDVTAADGSGWSVSGVSRDGRAPIVETDGSSSVTIKGPERGFDFVSGRTAWTVAVPRAPHLGFDLTLNAGDGTVDLAGTSLDGFGFTVNAGSLDLDLSHAAAVPTDGMHGTVNAGSANVNLPAFDGSMGLSMNAGSLTVCVPQGTALEVHWSGTIASHDLDSAGLVKTGDNIWTTPGFVAGSPHVALDVSANAGSFSLGLGGSCSG